jgi:hypothetical protein
MDAVGITWIYFTHPSEHPAHWLDGMGSGQIGFDIGAHRGYLDYSFYQGDYFCVGAE